MTHLLLALLIAGLTLQPPPASLAGSWVAEMNGVTFVRLELRVVSGRFAGEIGTGNIHMDSNGVVDSAQPVPAALTPIAIVETIDGGFSFTRVEGDDLERFRVRVTGRDTAELTFLPSDELLEEMKEEGIPAPKPMPLRRVR